MNLNEAYEFYAKHGGVGGTAKQLKETPCTLNQIKAATDNVLKYNGKNYDAELRRQAIQAETLLCLSKGLPPPDRNKEIAEINKEQQNAQKILVDYFPKANDPPANPYKAIKEDDEDDIDANFLDDMDKAFNDIKETNTFVVEDNEEEDFSDEAFFKALADMDGDTGMTGPTGPTKQIATAFSTISSISRIKNDYFIKLKEVNGDYCIRVPKDTEVLLKTNAYEYKVTPNALSVGDRICVTGYALEDADAPKEKYDGGLFDKRLAEKSVGQKLDEAQRELESLRAINLAHQEEKNKIKNELAALTTKYHTVNLQADKYAKQTIAQSLTIAQLEQQIENNARDFVGDQSVENHKQVSKTLESWLKDAAEEIDAKTLTIAKLEQQLKDKTSSEQFGNQQMIGRMNLEKWLKDANNEIDELKEQLNNAKRIVIDGLAGTYSPANFYLNKLKDALQIKDELVAAKKKQSLDPHEDRNALKLDYEEYLKPIPSLTESGTKKLLAEVLGTPFNAKTEGKVPKSVLSRYNDLDGKIRLVGDTWGISVETEHAFIVERYDGRHVFKLACDLAHGDKILLDTHIVNPNFNNNKQVVHTTRKLTVEYTLASEVKSRIRLSLQKNFHEPNAYYANCYDDDSFLVEEGQTLVVKKGKELKGGDIICVYEFELRKQTKDNVADPTAKRPAEMGLWDNSLDRY
jgi:hypothetical protein